MATGRSRPFDTTMFYLLSQISTLLSDCNKTIVSQSRTATGCSIVFHLCLSQWLCAFTASPLHSSHPDFPPLLPFLCCRTASRDNVHYIYTSCASTLLSSPESQTRSLQHGEQHPNSRHDRGQPVVRPRDHRPTHRRQLPPRTTRRLGGIYGRGSHMGKLSSSLCPGHKALANS